MLTPEGYYFNFSGTGNTLNCNNPVVRRYGARLPALLGGRIPHRRLPLRPRRGARPRPVGAPLTNPPLLESLAFDPVLAQLQADRRGVGRRRPVSGRLVPRLRPLGRVERQVPRLRPQVPQGRAGPDRRDGAALAGARPTCTAGAAPPRRSTSSPATTASRSHDLVVVQREAQRGQRRGQPRRRQRQRELELRRRGADRRPGGQRPAPPADQERGRDAAGQPGRADDPHGRRGRPHAARQQQHLLPRQRAELARLGAAGRRTPSCSGSSSSCIAFRKAHPVLRKPQLRGGARRTADRCTIVSWHGTRAWHADWAACGRTLAFLIAGVRDRGGDGRRDTHLRGHEHALGGPRLRAAGPAGRHEVARLRQHRGARRRTCGTSGRNRP